MIFFDFFSFNLVGSVSTPLGSGVVQVIPSVYLLFKKPTYLYFISDDKRSVSLFGLSLESL